MSDAFPVLLDQFGPTGNTPATKGQLGDYLPLTGGTMRGPLDMAGQNIINLGDFWSQNWDGAIPANLATEDATATAGGYFDASLGTLQLENDLFVGGDLTLSSGGTATFTGNITVGGTSEFTGDVTLGANLTVGTDGVVRTAASGQRIELTEEDQDRIRFYTGDDFEAISGIVRSNTAGASGSTMQLGLMVHAPITTGDSSGTFFLLQSESENDSTSPPEIFVRYLGGSSQTPRLRMLDGFRLQITPGTAALPGMAFEGITDKGFYSVSGSVAWATSGTFRGEFGQGIMVGSATGGDKGGGTINVATDIYKNNSAYTNPDWVFEMASTGRVSKYVDNLPDDPILRLIPLGELERFVMKHWHLPGITPDPMGMFERGDVALEWIERLVLYTFDLEERIGLLEAE